MIKLSKTSKLDGIKSWSLQALDTCPGSKDNNGALVPACAGCYATGGNYRFSNVKAPREHNKEDWKREDWVNDMIAALDNDRYFRWFDSGDMYDVRLAEKIYQVIKATPHCQHWLPTRMLKFKKFEFVLNKINALENAVVRFSSDSIQGEYDARHGSTIIPNDQTPTSAKVCHAYQNDGKCNGCRACWNKQTPVIAYVAHGRKMIKLVEA
jgi:Gene product 88